MNEWDVNWWIEMSATNEMTAIKWKRSERLHAARIVLHDMSNEMSMNVSWNANDLWNEWYSVELMRCETKCNEVKATKLKELKASRHKGAERRDNEARSVMKLMNSIKFTLISHNESEMKSDLMNELTNGTKGGWNQINFTQPQGKSELIDWSRC